VTEVEEEAARDNELVLVREGTDRVQQRLALQPVQRQLLGIDDAARLLGAGPQLENQPPAAPAVQVLHPVHHDPQQPRPKRRPRAEPAQAAERGDEAQRCVGVIRSLLRIG